MFTLIHIALNFGCLIVVIDILAQSDKNIWIKIGSIGLVISWLLGANINLFLQYRTSQVTRLLRKAARNI